MQLDVVFSRTRHGIWLLRLDSKINSQAFYSLILLWKKYFASICTETDKQKNQIEMERQSTNITTTLVLSKKEKKKKKRDSPKYEKLNSRLNYLSNIL